MNTYIINNIIDAFNSGKTFDEVCEQFSDVDPADILDIQYDWKMNL